MMEVKYKMCIRAMNRAVKVSSSENSSFCWRPSKGFQQSVIHLFRHNRSLCVYSCSAAVPPQLDLNVAAPRGCCEKDKLHRSEGEVPAASSLGVFHLNQV